MILNVSEGVYNMNGIGVLDRIPQFHTNSILCKFKLECVCLHNDCELTMLRHSYMSVAESDSRLF